MVSKIVELEKQLAVCQSELDKIRGVGRGVYSLPGVHYKGAPGEGMGGAVPVGEGGDGLGGGFGMSATPGDGLGPPTGLPPLPPKVPGMNDEEDEDNLDLKIKTRDGEQGLKKTGKDLKEEEDEKKERPEAPDIKIEEEDGDIPLPPMDIPDAPPLMRVVLNIYWYIFTGSSIRNGSRILGFRILGPFATFSQ